MKRQTTPVELNHVITGATLVALIDGATITPLVSGSLTTEGHLVSGSANGITFATPFDIRISEMCGVLRKVS